VPLSQLWNQRRKEVQLQAHVLGVGERSAYTEADYHRCPSRAEARPWRQDALVGLRKGTVKAPTRTTLAEAANAWVEGVQDGSIRTRSGDFYKPSAIRGYERALRLGASPPSNT
jgi:hypothetical protein